MQELDLSKLNYKEREKIIKGQELSGLSQKKYCNKYKISPTKFSYWKSKYNNSENKNTFQKVIYKESFFYLELILPNSLKLNLKLTDINLLKEVLSVLGELDVSS